MSIEMKYNPEFAILPNFFEFGNSGVDIFFVISGFIMATISQKYFKDKDKFYKFIYARFSRIYPLYWFYSILIVPVLYIRPEWVNSSELAQGRSVDPISTIFLFPTDTLPLIIVGWSLIHEIYFYIVFGFIILLVDKLKLIKYILMWAAMVILGNIFIKHSMPLIQLISHPLTIEFILGVLIGLYFLNYSSIRYPRTLLFISFSSFIAVFYLNEVDEIREWNRILLYGIPSFFLVFSSVNAEEYGLKFNKYLAKIGDSSYSIYLAHILVLSAVVKIFNILPFNGYMFEAIMVLTMITATLVWGLISYRYIEIPLINFTRRFL
jgi:peptidoglycan/LPS O-acetylase OafA/YrhL